MLASVKSCSKPSLTIESKEYQMINHFYNYPGNGKWEGITIKFVDAGNWGMDGTKPIAGRDVPLPSPNTQFTAHALWEMVIASGYTPPHWVTAIQEGGIGQNQVNSAFRGRSLISSPEKASMIDNSFGQGRLRIHQLHPQGRDDKGFVASIETWELYNPTITKVSWGDLDYGDDGLVEYTLDVKYDFAQFHPTNPNVSEESLKKAIEKSNQRLDNLVAGFRYTPQQRLDFSYKQATRFTLESAAEAAVRAFEIRQSHVARTPTADEMDEAVAEAKKITRNLENSFNPE